MSKGKMTQGEFLSLIREKLETEGFKKIQISPRLLSRNADVFARSKDGKKCEFKASLSRSKGKTFLRIEAVSDELEWIDQIESLEAFFDD